MNTYLTPAETTEELVNVGIKKTTRPTVKTAILGILAGAFIGMGSQLYTTVVTGTADVVGFGLTKMIGGIMFSVGLMFVIIVGADLFTGDSLLVIGVLEKKIKLKSLLKNWAIVYIFNFIGSILLAWIIFGTGLNGHATNGAGVDSLDQLQGLTAVGTTAVKIANAKVGLTFIQVLTRGILANWLVCIAVMMAVAAKDIAGKVFAILFPVMTFVAIGLEHSIANMYFMVSAMFTTNGMLNTLTIQAANMNILAATIGNIIGGGFFVATIYWFVYLKNPSVKGK